MGISLKRIVLLGMFLAGLTACGGYYGIPEDIQDQVDRSITFDRLRAEPDGFIGKTVVLGGIVLNATHIQEGTLIEILQVPLNRYDRPVGRPEESMGRFLLIDPQRTDPAVISQRRVTIVGEAMKSRTRMVDEYEYRFPTLKAEFIQVWPVRRTYVYPDPYPYYYGPYPYGYPYYGYPYYSPYPPVIHRPPDRRFDPEPAPPPPSKKKKRRFEK